MMTQRLGQFFLLAGILVGVPCGAAPSAPVAGSFGFDWLKPTSARCVALPQATLDAFASCEYKKDGTFGLRDPAFVCRKSARSEYFIYASKAVCQRNLETMEANAP